MPGSGRTYVSGRKPLRHLVGNALRDGRPSLELNARFELTLYETSSMCRVDHATEERKAELPVEQAVVGLIAVSSQTAIAGSIATNMVLQKESLERVLGGLRQDRSNEAGQARRLVLLLG